MNEQEALNKLSNTVVLQENDEKFQFVYATQLYGSVFSLFANFEASNAGNCINIDKIHLIGVNYKGNVALGIHGVRPPSMSNGYLDLEVTLQADETAIHTPIYTVPTDLDIPQDTQLRVTRELRPMTGDAYYDDDTTIVNRSFLGGKFDSEFFARDGFYIRDKQPDWIALEDYYMGAASNLPGSNCKIGLSRIILA